MLLLFPKNNITSLIPIILIGGTQQGKKNMRKLGRRATREQAFSSLASAWLSRTLLPTWKPSGQKRPTWTSSKRLRWVKVSFSIVSNSLFFGRNCSLDWRRTWKTMTRSRKIWQKGMRWKNGITDACSTADCWQYAPDVVQDMPQMIPQTCPRWCHRHSFSFRYFIGK